MGNSIRRSLRITAIAFVSWAIHPAQAGHSSAPFGVEFSGCVESIGVALAPIENVVALTPFPFVPFGMGGPVSPIVVRTADCAGIAVDGGKPKPGSIVQIGAVIFPPIPGGDIDNYTFWYYTTSEKLAHRLQDLGVSAQHVANMSYDLDPAAAAATNDLQVIVKRPGDPRLSISGTVLPSTVFVGSFEAVWWQKTATGNVRMDTQVPEIAIGSADLGLATDAGNPLGTLIGGGAIGFWVLQQFNVFSGAHMAVGVP